MQPDVCDACCYQFGTLQLENKGWLISWDDKRYISDWLREKNISAKIFLFLCLLSKKENWIKRIVWFKKNLISFIVRKASWNLSPKLKSNSLNSFLCTNINISMRWEIPTTQAVAVVVLISFSFFCVWKTVIDFSSFSDVFFH